MLRTEPGGPTPRTLAFAAGWALLFGSSVGAFLGLRDGLERLAAQRYVALGFSRSARDLLVGSTDGGAFRGLHEASYWVAGALLLCAAIPWLRRALEPAELSARLADPTQRLRFQLVLAAAWGLGVLALLLRGAQPTRTGLLVLVLIGADLVFLPELLERLPGPWRAPERRVALALGLGALLTGIYPTLVPGVGDSIGPDAIAAFGWLLLGSAGLGWVAGELVRARALGRTPPLAVRMLLVLPLLPGLAPLIVRTTGGVDRGAWLEPQRTASVLLVALDGVRPDAVPLGPDPADGATPAAPPDRDLVPWKRFAQRGTVYADATTPAPSCLPAWAAVTTGRAPEQPGVLTPEGALAPAVVTLAELLREVGYATCAVTDFPPEREPQGLFQGYEFVLPAPRRSRQGNQSASVTDAALAFVDENRGEPWFLFAHYGGALDAFAAPPRGAQPGAGTVGSSIEDARATYRARAASVVTEVARLLGGIQDRGLAADLVVVLVSDHGAALGERGVLGYGGDLYQEALHVPLAISLPPPSDALPASGRPVTTRGVFATVLDALGLVPPGAVGLEALPRLDAPVTSLLVPGAPDAPDTIGGIGGLGALGAVAVRDEAWKLVEDRAADRRTLFDLERDPGETRDLAAERPDVVERLLGRARAALGAQEPESGGP